MAVEERLKQRLTGAVVLILAGVVFIPMLLNNPDLPETVRNDVKKVGKTQDRLGEQGHKPAEQAGPTESNNNISLTDAEAVEIEPISEDEPLAAPTDTKKPAHVSASSNTPPAIPKPARDVATEPKAVPPTVPPHGEKVGVAAWVIQLGSFSSEENAAGLVSQLKSRGFTNAFAEKLYAKHGKVFRVRVGPELLEAKARQVQARIEREINLKGIVVKYP